MAVKSDHTILDELKSSTSWQETQARLGEFLGLDGPAPIAIVRRAMQEEQFCYYLITARNHPELLKFLLADPKNAKYDMAETAAGYTSAQLARKAAGALASWGRAGFSRVDDEVFEQRFGACLACEHLVDPPDRIVYKATVGAKSDKRVCAACGCVAARKARLTSESCPVAHREMPGMTRWGEPAARSRE